MDREELAQKEMRVEVLRQEVFSLINSPGEDFAEALNEWDRAMIDLMEEYHRRLSLEK